MSIIQVGFTQNQALKKGPAGGSYESQESIWIAVGVGEPRGDHNWVANGTI